MFGLTWRVALVFSVPVVSLSRKANAGTLYHNAVTIYQTELLIALCLLMMCVGCLASIITPDPDGVQPIKPMAKFVYSLLGSLSAMFYIGYYEQQLTIVHPAWVGGVAFVAPAIVPSVKKLVFELLPVAHNAAKAFLTRWLGSKGGDNG